MKEAITDGCVEYQLFDQPTGNVRGFINAGYTRPGKKTRAVVAQATLLVNKPADVQLRIPSKMALAEMPLLTAALAAFHARMAALEAQREQAAALPVWVVGRFPSGTWTSGGERSDSVYAECEVWEIPAATREQAVKKAQQLRSQARRQGKQTAAAQARAAEMEATLDKLMAHKS